MHEKSHMIISIKQQNKTQMKYTSCGTVALIGPFFGFCFCFLADHKKKGPLKGYGSAARNIQDSFHGNDNFLLTTRYAMSAKQC